ncbi:dynein axonemal assembly factor 19-like [Clavelina lepadiformis]
MCNMNNFNDDIDFKMLEKEIGNAVAHDDRYQRENDAKFRAINQKVRSYDEFRDIVAASHIKPLGRHDKLGGMNYQKWNPVSNNSASDTGAKAKNNPSTTNLQLPKNSQDFFKTWKRTCTTYSDKWNYLLRIERMLLQNCLNLECPVGEILNVIYKCSAITTHMEKVIDILDIMTKSKRFSLELDFLSGEERKQLEEVFASVQSNLENTSEESLKNLQQAYRLR